jgi:thiamine kinase-like enzyme
MAEVAGLVRTYQDDEELARVLSFGDEWRQKDSVRDAVTEIFQGLDRALPPVFRSATVMESVTRWQAEAQDIASAPLRPVHVSTRSSSVLAPVHCDPNSKNFLLSHDRVYLVDWDEATLSDPMRDIGPLLWWYLPRLQWSEFLGHYGTEMSSEMEGRVYWWAAHRSISVALWIAQHSMESARIDDFLTDFVAAASGADNPKGRLP